MRIISGIYGGRRFDFPKNLQTRPTTDIAKESLFNILQNLIDFDGIKALDLFGGTGSISFELLSRGASHVTCVEMGRGQQGFIREVANKLNIKDSFQLVRGDVFKFLKSQVNLTSSEGTYDLIFADPPYALEELPTLPQIILSSDMLKPQALFVLEHGKDYNFEGTQGHIETRVYGAVHFSFFQK